MKLSAWAKQIGITYNTAWRMYKAGKIPHKTEQLPTGTIIIHPATELIGDKVVYMPEYHQEIRKRILKDNWKD